MQKLSEDQIEEYKDAFRVYDQDNNGFITTSELCKVMRTLGFNPTEEELQDMIFEVDYDANGELDFNEFIELMELQKKPEDVEEDIVDAFRVFDPDNNGFVEADELRDVMNHTEVKVNQADMEGLLQFYGFGENRKIRFDEFSTFVEPNKEQTESN